MAFQTGTLGVDYQEIPRQMELFAEEFSNPSHETTSEELFSFFEKVHPFEDGNGRLGDLLWKIDVTRRTGVWPKFLPPESF